LAPGPSASDCATSTCRHLTRSGIPRQRCPAISGTASTASRWARYARAPLGTPHAGRRRLQPLGHLAHRALGLEGADRPAARGQVR
jgi:hypothetical protein